MKKLVLLLLLSIVLVSCVPAGNDVPLPAGFPADFSHMNYFVIDGMPCIYIDSGIEEGGISCDWSKWNGTVEDGEIVLP